MANWGAGLQGAGSGAAAGAAFGPWGAGIGAGLGLLGGLMSSNGTQAGNYYMSPSQMNSQFRQLNPWLYGAMTNSWTNGATPLSGLGKSFYNMVNNPGYIDPRVMNLPYYQIEQNAGNNLQRMSNMIGRNAGQGGVSNMYALANLATRGQQRAGVAQNYAIQRAQLARQDLASLMGWMNQGQFGQSPQYWQGQSGGVTAGNALQGLGMAWPYLMQGQQSGFQPYWGTNSSGATGIGYGGSGGWQ
jgi:hypothetical protein